LSADDLEWVISRSRKWKCSVSSKRLLLGPGCYEQKCPALPDWSKGILTFDLDWHLGVISRSRKWKSPISSSWCEISIWLLWNTIGKSISAFQNPQKNLTLNDLEEVISRSRKWKWPVLSKRLLLGPGCRWTKMFSIAQLIKVHLYLWPWLTFMGHFKVKNVKIAYIFFMVRDKHVVTMKHYWEVDIGLSESAKIIWPWMTLKGPFQGHESENGPYRLNGCS